MKNALMETLLSNDSGKEPEIDSDIRQASLQGPLEQLKGGFSGNYEQRFVWCEGPLLFIGSMKPAEFHPMFKMQSVSAQSFRHGGNCFKLIINYTSIETGKPDVTTLRTRDEDYFKKWYSCLYFNCYAPMNKKALMDKAGESINDLSQGKKTLDFSVGMLRFLREAWPGGSEDLLRVVNANDEKQKHKTLKERFTIDSKAAKDAKKWAKLFKCILQTKRLEITSGVAKLGGTEELIHLDMEYFRDCVELYLDHIRVNTIHGGDHITKLLLRNTTGDITPFRNTEKLCITETEMFDWKLIRELAKTLCIIEIHSFLRDENVPQIFIGTPGRPMENTDWFRLRILDLSDNAIEHLPKCFEKIPMLERIILDRNDLTSLDGLGTLSTLVYVSASKNKLSRVAALAACSSLTYIDLSYNQIVDFPWSYVKSCMLLDLSHNQIDSFDGVNALTTNQSLMSLSLCGNHLQNRLDYLPILQVLFRESIRGEGIKLDGSKLKNCDDETAQRITSTYSDVLTYEYSQAPMAADTPVVAQAAQIRGADHQTIEVERILPKKKKVKVVRRKKRRNTLTKNEQSGSQSSPSPREDDSHPVVPAVATAITTSLSTVGATSVPQVPNSVSPPLEASAHELQTKVDLKQEFFNTSNQGVVSNTSNLSKEEPAAVSNTSRLSKEEAVAVSNTSNLSKEEPVAASNTSHLSTEVPVVGASDVIPSTEVVVEATSAGDRSIINETIEDEPVVSSPEVMPVSREDLDKEPIRFLGTSADNMEEEPLASGGSEMFAAAAAPIRLTQEEEKQTMAYVRDSMRSDRFVEPTDRYATREQYATRESDDHSSLEDEYELVSLGDDYLPDDIVIPQEAKDRSQLPEDLQNFISLITKPAQTVFGLPALAISFIIGWYKKYWSSIGGRSWAKTQKALVILCHVHLVFVVPFVFIFAGLPCDGCTEEDSYNDQKFRYFISAMVVLSSVFQTAFGIMAIFYENIVMLIAFNLLTVVLATRYVFNMVYYSKDASLFQLLVPPIVEICFEIVYFVTSLLIGPNFNSLVCFRVGGGPHLVKLYKHAQIYSAVAKTDCLFVGLSAIVAGFWYVENTTQWVFLGILSAMSLYLFLSSIRWMVREHRKRLAGFVVFSIAIFVLQFLMIYHLYMSGNKTLKDRLSEAYHATVLTITAAALCRFLTLGLLFLCTRSFGSGLKEALATEQENSLWGTQL
eukprot:TRINITY_DN5079_c3_g1_i1.p1 TRINITY_DN5079_c3_g1~~TRINITY_DN5079_c3_g1_i1.p1  ORF type:complete len:1202 (+),score=195.66 TRINITY_DN5079_c3_g1_i1:114-3719(+)